jgi:hypothetical protein
MWFESVTQFAKGVTLFTPDGKKCKNRVCPGFEAGPV